MNKPQYGKLVKALLEYRGKSQKELAIYLNTSTTNLSDRIRKNSFTNVMLDNVCLFFDLDVRRLAALELVGQDPFSVLAQEEASKEKSKTITIELTTEDVRQILLNQGKSMDDIRAEMKSIAEQFKELLKLHPTEH
jgi:transcriptional regulator with XRE-family HTH domain